MNVLKGTSKAAHFRAFSWCGIQTIDHEISVTRLGDFLHFGQPFKAGGNNYFTHITHIVRQFLQRYPNHSFFSEFKFGQLLYTFGNFYLVTCMRSWYNYPGLLCLLKGHVERTHQMIRLDCYSYNVYLHKTVRTSVTRLSDFWKFSVRNFLTRVTKMLVDFLGYFERHLFLSKLPSMHFGQL